MLLFHLLNYQNLTFKLILLALGAGWTEEKSVIPVGPTLKDPAEVLGETLKPRNSHWFRALEGLMVRRRTLACHQTEAGAAGEEASLSSG